jgi:hypothetical protein
VGCAPESSRVVSHHFQNGRMRDSATHLGHLCTSLGGHRTDTLFCHCLPSGFLASDSRFCHALTYLCNAGDCPAALVGGVVIPVNTFVVVAPCLALFGFVGLLRSLLRNCGRNPAARIYIRCVHSSCVSYRAASSSSILSGASSRLTCTYL